MVGGGDIQAQPVTQEGRLWKSACEAAENRAEAAEARIARLADMNERLINETHASWLVARADADGWHRVVEMILTIAGLSPAPGATEALIAMRDELERRASCISSGPSRDRLAEIIGSFPLTSEAEHDNNWLRTIRDAFEGGPEKRAEAVYQLVDDVLAEFSLERTS